MKMYLSHAMVSALCGALGMFTFAIVTHAPVGASSVAAEAFTVAEALTVTEAPAAAEAVTVTMTDTRFAPATIRIRRGETVTWRNTSQMVHTVTGAGFDSGNMAAGTTFSRTFDAAGTYSYHCKPHQAAGMVGSIVVTN
jgi:plastocyanin